MAVFLIDDKNVDSAPITATGLNAPSYPFAGVDTELVVPNFFDSGSLTIKMEVIPALSCNSPSGNSSTYCSDGGSAYYRLTWSGWDSVTVDGVTMTYYLTWNRRGQEYAEIYNGQPVSWGSAANFSLAPSRSYFSTGTVTLFLDDFDPTFNGEDLDSWEVAVRPRWSQFGSPQARTGTTGPAGVLYPSSPPAPYIFGDAYYPNLPVALGAGKVLVVSDREDRDGDHAFHPEARIYTTTDAGWTRSTASILPRQSYTAQALCKTLDSSVLIQTDKSTAGAAAPGYYVATVSGSAVTGGSLEAVIGTGAARSDSTSMVRLPGSNDFLSWRQHDDAVYVDLIRVAGSTCQVLNTATVAPPAGLTNPDMPRALVVAGSSSAIGALTYGAKVQLVHAAVTADVITITTGELTTTYTESATVYPGLDHTAEIMLRNGSAGSKMIKRLGVEFAGGVFSTTVLPITQLDATAAPYGYELRTEDGAVAPFKDACYFPIGGDLYVARKLSDGTTDGNWLVVHQYNQSAGTILASEWSKGEMNGGGLDVLSTTPLHMVYEPARKQLVVTASEEYHPNSASDFSMNARIATFRTNYVLAQQLRSQGWAFSG